MSQNGSFWHSYGKPPKNMATTINLVSAAISTLASRYPIDAHSPATFIFTTTSSSLASCILKS
jgi:hypothetical protein